MRFSDPLLSASPPPNFLFFMIGWCILLFGSLIASGVGLLKRRKWARISSIVLLLLMMLSVLASFQSNPSEAATASASYRLGEAIGQSLIWGSFGLSLYALTLNKAVKRYFDHNEESNHS
jgi:energy-coupling factor transporter transmembrane protein EcfT